MWAVAAFLLFLQADYTTDGTKALDQGKYDDAVQAFRKAIEADAKDYFAHFNLAMAYTMLQRDPQALIEARVADIAGHIVEPARECRPHVGVELGVLAELLHAGAHFFAEVIVGERRARNADDGESRGKPPVEGQPVERGQQLALGEVAIGAEDHDDALGDLAFEAERVLERVLVGH